MQHFHCQQVPIVEHIFLDIVATSHEKIVELLLAMCYDFLGGCETVNALFRQEAHHIREAVGANAEWCFFRCEQGDRCWLEKRKETAVEVIRVKVLSRW